MYQLSASLTKKRMKEGSIDLILQKRSLNLMHTEKPIKLFKKVRLESHRLVEEFMLLANRVVARHMD